MDDQYVNEISLVDLFNMLLSKWYIIVIFSVIGFGAAFFYAYQALDNEYTAKTSIIILVKNEQLTSEQNFNLSSKLQKTYTELLKSELVTSQVISQLNLDLTSSKLGDLINVTAVPDTTIVKISIVTNDPYLSQEIANKAVSVMQMVTLDFEGLDNIEILDLASLPLIPSGPNRMLYIIIGFILGSIIGVGFVLVRELLDSTIKTADDIETKLNIRVLSVIQDYKTIEDVK